MNSSQARRIVVAVRNGLVGRRIEKSSSSARRRMHVSTHSMSGEVAVANSAGRRPGTSAP